MTALAKKLAALLKTARDAEAEAKRLVLGRKVRITSDYNGMPHGRSRKPLTGQVREVIGLWFDRGTAYVELDGKWVPLGLDEVEFLESEPQQRVRKALARGQQDMERARQAQRGRRRS